MIQAALFDIDNRLSDEISAYAFWHNIKDVVYLGRQSSSELEKGIADNSIDIILAVTNCDSFLQTDFLTKIISTCNEIAVIIISENENYKAVRQAFKIGAFDYLLFNNLEKHLKKAIINISSRKTDAYFSEKIYDKIKILASHIFNGGDNVLELVDDMVESVYKDRGGDDIACQQIIERIKLESYKFFVRSKPWLEKFIYRGDYVLGIGFELKSKEAVKQQLFRYYSDINMLFKKYNVIDVNKTIYTIGKSIINNIDKKISLDFVADDVYLNKTYISHIFKKMTGISFSAFLLDVKIERAKVLLHYPDLSVNEIAEMLNFCNASYFGATFKKYTEYTPSEYREFIKNN